MFKKNDRIVYPVYGMSIINGIVSENVSNQEIKCYEILFLDSQLTISVPVDRAASLGLRYPLAKKELRETLKELYKKITLKEEDIPDLEEFCQIKLKSGNIRDVIELINILLKINRKRIREDKKLNMNESDSLKKAKLFLASEVATVLGKKALDYYQLAGLQE